MGMKGGLVTRVFVSGSRISPRRHRFRDDVFAGFTFKRKLRDDKRVVLDPVFWLLDICYCPNILPLQSTRALTP